MKSLSTDLEARRAADRLMIFEMMEAGILLAEKKGSHPLISGCNCIVCVNKRKRILAGLSKPWRYRL
jgi:hypothetical protein